MRRHATIKPCRKKDLDPDRPASKQKVCLYSKKDPSKLLGRHPNEESARKQEIAIQINKNARSATMETVQPAPMVNRYRNPVADFANSRDAQAAAAAINDYFGDYRAGYKTIGDRLYRVEAVDVNLPEFLQIIEDAGLGNRMLKSAGTRRMGDEPSEKMVKKWMFQEVYEDPNDWVDSGMEPLYTELAEAAALFFDVDYWLDDDTHPIWDWSIAVLDQVFAEESEAAYEPYLDKTDRSLLKRSYFRPRVLVDDVDITAHVRGPIRVRRAVSKDPYERAVERLNDAICRRGIFSGFQALRNRIKKIKNPDKLEGVAILVEKIEDEIEETLRVLEGLY